jgi:hypothetical protein
MQPTFDGDELVLGARTNLAVVRRDGVRQGEKSPRVDEARLSALLAIAYGRSISALSLAHARRAVEKMREGDTTMALMNLALTGLGKLTDVVEDSRRLSMADGLMTAGVEPRVILQALELESGAPGGRAAKYDPDQPRVPAGSGRASGQWTSGQSATDADVQSTTGDAVQSPIGDKESATSGWSRFLEQFNLIGAAEAAEAPDSPTARLRTAMRLAEEGRLPPPGSWAADAENLGAPVAQTKNPDEISQPADSAAAQRMRARIVSLALENVNSMDWSQEGENGAFPAGTDKCNLFVHDMLAAAGADPGEPNRGWLNVFPPTAAQWADPDFNIPHWTMLGLGETPLQGDVVAQEGNYINASGHVMIIGPNDTVIGTKDTRDSRSGYIEWIPKPQSIVESGREGGPKVYRRWRP